MSDDTKRGEDRELRCDFCDKVSSIMQVEIEYETEPNTLTNLRSVGYVKWKCPFCGCFNPET
jgi:phage FluMu protein Com